MAVILNLSVDRERLLQIEIEKVLIFIPDTAAAVEDCVLDLGSALVPLVEPLLVGVVRDKVVDVDLN